MIRKAVIPAAGLGTRFLPATKSQPKEMLPVGEKPAIQHVVEEAVAAGITDILIIVSTGKRAIEEHFDRSLELEAHLRRRKDVEGLRAIRRISEMANIHYVRQKQSKGLGHAVLCAKDHVGDAPFAVLLADTLVTADAGPAIGLLAAAHERCGRSAVLLEQVPRERVSRYGVAAGREGPGGLLEVTDLVEKPDADEAPSNLAIAGRYVFRPEIFADLARTKKGAGGEIQLTDAMRRLAERGALCGVRLEGKAHDLGDALGYLKANIEFVLRRKETSREMREFMKKVLKRR